MVKVIDYKFDLYKRSSLYLKRSKGAPIPTDFEWQCPCGVLNKLNDQQEQYCPKCGARLRLQEQRSDDEDSKEKMEAGVLRYTVVRVAHFTIYPNG